MKKISISFLVLFFAIVTAFGQKEKFEAIYIYNFTKKIEWPKEASTGDFIIGVLGEAGVTPNLEKMAATRKVGTRKIVVKKFSNASEVSTCHILFVSPDQCSNLGSVQNQLVGNNTLFITDKKGMAKSGAGINFLMKDGKLKFELNKKNVTKNGLKVSADLEKLAIVV